MNPLMTSIRWVGPSPKPPLRAALLKAGFEPADTGDITVATALEGRSGAWLWLASQVTHDQAVKAAALGAYDAVTPERLVARLQELMAPISAAQPPKGF